MKKPSDAVDRLLARAGNDIAFRERLLAKPKETLEAELGVTLVRGHRVQVHEECLDTTHIVLPPRNKFTEAEREAARTGAASLEFLRKTLYDPAPPARLPASQRGNVRCDRTNTEALAEAGRESIRRGLVFLESTIDENGAWQCIRFNIADPEIPRHFERPPFVSALCVLALESCHEPAAKSICTASKAFLIQTMEFPGLWRYYRHLPHDLDSTALCSLVIGPHPWILLGRNVSRILANRDDEGRFMTWVLADDEPDVVSPFRIEADPVVNANVIAYLGDQPETTDAQRWLEALIVEGKVGGSSKWYPDETAIYYATARAVNRVRPALDQLRLPLRNRILGLRDESGEFGNVLQTAQAVSALHGIGCLDRRDAQLHVDKIMCTQREDGSWPELLAFGDQSLRWGKVGQIGHGSEAVTSAFCIEALERLLEVLRD